MAHTSFRRRSPRPRADDAYGVRVIASEARELRRSALSRRGVDVDDCVRYVAAEPMKLRA